MKTDKFEKTIRRKLESISPNFQEDDWAKMQNYMQAHTPPSVWQQYGSWLAYAAAASVTTVMAFLYAGQITQTNELAGDVKKLQSQIEVIQNTPVLPAKTDTVYIVQKEVSKDQFYAREQSRPSEQRSYAVHPERNNLDSNDGYSALKKQDDRTVFVEKSVQNPGSQQASNHSNGNTVRQAEYSDRSVSPNKNRIEQFATSSGSEAKAMIRDKALDNSFAELAGRESMQLPNNSGKMNYALKSRLSGRQIRNILLANTPVTARTVEHKKVKQITKAENTIPRLNLKVPYRFGGGIQFEGGNKVKTITGEVLVSKKISVSTGLSWIKIKPMEFFTEKIFRDKNRKDFKKSHPDLVPTTFEVLNINVKPTLVQIPLTVAFRDDLKNDFSYYASAGTNITVKGREQFAFDCRLPMPSQEFRNQSFERKMDIPLVNSLNLSVGIEKTWHPIVVQVEGYLYSYFKPISPETPKTGPGVKLKLLYQIGRKM